MKKQCMGAFLFGAIGCVASVVAGQEDLKIVTRENFKTKFNEAIKPLNIKEPQFSGQNTDELREYFDVLGEYFELVFKPNALEEQFKLKMQSRKQKVAESKEPVLTEKQEILRGNFDSNKRPCIREERFAFRAFTILTDSCTYVPLFNDPSDANGVASDDKNFSLGWSAFKKMYDNKKRN